MANSPPEGGVAALGAAGVVRPSAKYFMTGLQVMSMILRFENRIVYHPRRADYSR